VVDIERPRRSPGAVCWEEPKWLEAGGSGTVRRTLKRSITARTLVVGIALAALFGAVFLVLVLAIQQQRQAGRLALRSQEAITAGTDLEKSLINMENGLRGYVATGRERLLEPFDAGRRAYPRQVTVLTRLVADEPSQQAAVRRIASDIDDYVALWALPLVQLAGERLPSARSVIATGTGRRRLDALRAEFADLFVRERAVARERELKAEQRSDVAVGIGVAGVALVVLLAIGMWQYLRRAILRPVGVVAGAAEAVAAGDLSVRVPEAREDELGSLARSFNAMTASLERSQAELRRRTAELERSNAELEQYAQMASHDLQAPLATISMYVELLRRRAAESGDEQAAELLGGIHASSGWMRSLIRDLLHLSRVGRGELERETLDTDELLGQALDNLAGPIRDRGAEIVAGPLPPVQGDGRQLAQVFQNLIGNAIKFSDEEHPHVSVEGVVDGDVVVFLVRDNGIGIDPAQIERIFRPFERLHGEARYEGTGVGLAICRRIVEHHGGEISAEGLPGVGSTFRFTVPRAPGPAAIERPPAPQATMAQ
jgi:signal transduction histidine kinase